MTSKCLRACLVAIGVLFACDAGAQALDPTFPLSKEADRYAPIDYGYGPGVKPPRRAGAAPASMAAADAEPVPVGGSQAHVQGMFGPAVTWPIIAIHAVLLPDGRVLNYGTDEAGKQGSQLVYAIWDPALGTGSDAHLVLPNTTATDIFCSAQSVLSATGEVLITGGDLTVDGKRNYSNDRTTLFRPATETTDDEMTSDSPMAYARWYPTIVALPSSEMLVVGGRSAPGVRVLTPEIYNRATGWRALTGATSSGAFGGGNWFYPNAFVTPAGKVFVLGKDGAMFNVTTAGNGTIARVAQKTLAGHFTLPSVMYARGQILSLRASQKVITVDVRKQPPTATPTADISQVRMWSNATVLADGKVVVTGGSAEENKLAGVAYHAEIWTPATGQWTRGADAEKPRLYHSTALLMPDATVLTAGGGAPGPVKNLNAEIYYPPYLYKKDGSGQPEVRPTLESAPSIVRIGQPFEVTVGAGQQINRMTMVRTGSTTHAFDPDQRFLQLPFTQSGQSVTATMSSEANVAVPGYYLLFAFQRGVPSVARIIHVVI